jgi:hypothetical protein
MAQEEAAWTPPSWVNSDIVRLVALAASLGLGVASTSGQIEGLSSFIPLIHLFSWALWFGISMYTTFVLGLALFKSVDRRTFGKVQSVLFPIYFLLQTCTILLAALTCFPPFHTPFHKTLLMIPGGCAAMNMLLIGPSTSRVMFKRHQMEDREETEKPEYNALKKRFGMLHGISSLLNLVCVCFGVYQGYILAQSFGV